MIRGLGIDLMEVERIQSALERHPRFLTRVYSPAEQETILRRGAEAAAMFAAKEAVAKALGTGFRGFTTRDISVEPDALGRPAVRLSGGALERLHTLGAQSVMISITHTGGFAAAVAVIE